MNNIRQDFSRHWEHNLLPEIATTKRMVAQRFLEPVIGALVTSNGLLLLDAGCGDGVHAKVLRKINADFKYLGIDISDVAVKSSQARVADPRFRFQVNDLESLDLPDNSFDIVFSYGVIAYLENPMRGINEISRVVRPGGLIGIWVYPQKTGFMGMAFNAVRWVCRHGGSVITNFMANIIVPFLPLLPTASQVHLGNATWAQCKEVVLVNIAPTNLYFPTHQQLIGWIESTGLKVLFEQTDIPYAVWAIKRPPEEK